MSWNKEPDLGCMDSDKNRDCLLRERNVPENGGRWRAGKEEELKGPGPGSFAPLRTICIVSACSCVDLHSAVLISGGHRAFCKHSCFACSPWLERFPVSFAIGIFLVYIKVPLEPPSVPNLVCHCHFVGMRAMVTLAFGVHSDRGWRWHRLRAARPHPAALTLRLLVKPMEANF